MDSYIDETIPLEFSLAIYEHFGCGGLADKAKHVSETYCYKCERTVPSREVGLVLEMLTKTSYNDDDVRVA